MYLCCLAMIAAFVATPNVVRAGQLFPPLSATGTMLPTGAGCPIGQMLNWNGASVKCVPMTPKVTTGCPAGHGMTEIQAGVAICAPLVKGDKGDPGDNDVVYVYRSERRFP